MQYRGKENPNGNSEKQSIIKNEQEMKQRLKSLEEMALLLEQQQCRVQKEINRLRAQLEAFQPTRQI